MLAEGKTDLCCLKSIFVEHFGNLAENYNNLGSQVWKWSNADYSLMINIHLYSQDKPAVKKRWRDRYKQFELQGYLYRFLHDTDDPTACKDTHYIENFQERIAQSHGLYVQKIIPVQPEIEAWQLASLVNALMNSDNLSTIGATIQKLTKGYTTTEHVGKEAWDALDDSLKNRAYQSGLWKGSGQYNRTLELFLLFVEEVYDAVLSV